MAAGHIPSAPRARRPETRPAEIMEAALDVFSSKGFNAASLDQVAKAADVTKGAIYHYFDGKEDLLLKALRHWIERTLGPWQELEEDLPEAGPVSARLRLVIRYMWEIWQEPEMVSVLRLIEGELVYHHPRVVERWHTESVQPAVQNIVDMVEEGKTKGEIRKDLDTEVVVQFLLAGLNKVAAQKHSGLVSPVSSFPSDRIIDSILDIFFRGVRS